MKLKHKENSNDYIRIRVTKEEKEFMKKEATKRGTTLTDLVKAALNEYLDEK